MVFFQNLNIEDINKVFLGVLLLRSYELGCVYYYVLNLLLYSQSPPSPPPPNYVICEARLPHTHIA
jgi:hypothetical protein